MDLHSDIRVEETAKPIDIANDSASRGRDWPHRLRSFPSDYAALNPFRLPS
jgi:hypothetical protein